MNRAALLATLCFVATTATAQAPIGGLTAGPALASAYDAILNADFDSVAARLEPACATVPPFCTLMDAISAWWQISLDPDNREPDARFLHLVERAIDEAGDWTRREPQRAEAWLALGGAFSARAQWRVLRNDRLAAARDGKRIKRALERALTLDGELHDARFGLGMYRYYADVTPAVFRFLRWLLFLPGGDREQGLADMHDAYTHGTLMRGEAEYQLHLIYLWYEGRPHDALKLVERLQARYPRNPRFYLAEADIHAIYLHDADASIATLEHLLRLAADEAINASSIAERDARARLTRHHARMTP